MVQVLPRSIAVMVLLLRPLKHVRIHVQTAFGKHSNTMLQNIVAISQPSTHFKQVGALSVNPPLFSTNFTLSARAYERSSLTKALAF